MAAEKKSRIIVELLVVLMILSLTTFITKFWALPLVMLGILVCALRLQFIKVSTDETTASAAPSPLSLLPDTQKSENEICILQRAFGLLTQRVTEQVESQYPGARWTWGVQNAFENYKHGYPLLILLNGAGGYQKARVEVFNLQFKGLSYLSCEPDEAQHEPPSQLRATEQKVVDEDPDYVSQEELPVNYERLAFEWVDANIADFNSRCNELLAQGTYEMLIPSEQLPHPDSLPDICAELERNGFPTAAICEEGIEVNLPH